MSFKSILYTDRPPAVQSESEAVFRDLNLPPIFSAILTDPEMSYLREIYCSPLTAKADILYRQKIMSDIISNGLYKPLDDFCRTMRHSLEIQKQTVSAHYQNSKEYLQLQAVSGYVAAVSTLHEKLSLLTITSYGIKQFYAGLQKYISSAEFLELSEGAAALLKALSEIDYTLQLKANEITVSRYDGEKELTAEIKNFFKKFEQAPIKAYKQMTFYRSSVLNHIEEQITDRLELLYPDIFERMHRFWQKTQIQHNTMIGNFYREVQFYLVYSRHMQKLRQNGIPFCFPAIYDSSKVIFCQEGYDTALACQFPEKKITANSIRLSGKERTAIVTGPNQGGKTTFARMIGQLIYLAHLGLPVPAASAGFSLTDAVYTHFERREAQSTLNGKLQDDIVRIYRILKSATADSFIVINEMFASTTLQDAVWLGKKVMEQISRKDLFCIYVTFLEELSVFDEKTISLVSQIEDGTEKRTFHISRADADGKAYALSLAKKYALTCSDILARISL